MESAQTAIQAPIWMLIPRIILAFLYLYLDFNHLVNPKIFQKTLQLPALGILFWDLMQIPTTNPHFFTFLRIFTALSEIIIGSALLIGFLLRFFGSISSILLLLITSSLIPNWFMLFLFSYQYH